MIRAANVFAPLDPFGRGEQDIRCVNPNTYLLTPPSILALMKPILILFAIALMLPSRTDADDAPSPILLRYIFQSGQFVHYEVESETSLTIAKGQAKQTSSETRHEKKHYRVVSAGDDGSAVLEPVIDEAVLEAKTDGGNPRRFDSRSDEPVPRAFQAVKEDIGRPFVRIRHNANGRAVEVLPIVGIDKKLPAEPQHFAFLTVFPEKAILIGDSWNDDITAPVGVRLSETKTLRRDIAIRRRYTLKAVEDGIAVIEFRTYPIELKLEPSLQAQLIQRTTKGEIRFDIKLGRLLETRTVGEGNVTAPFGEDSFMTSKSSGVEKYVANPSRPAVALGPDGPPETKPSNEAEPQTN